MKKDYVTYEEMYKTLESKELDINFTSKDIVKNPAPLKDKVDENYKFVKKNIFFKIGSFLFYLFAFIILFPLLSIMYAPKVRGRKNLKKVKNAVFISNHIFMLDCAILNTHILKFRRPYFIVNKENLQMPVVCGMIKLFKAVPIPSSVSAYKKFLTEVDNELKQKQSILIYPEGSMWPYYPNIRPFNSGAFRFSVQNNVPVVPICISFRKPNWFYKIFGRKKPLLNITVLEPIFPDKNNPKKLEENRINEIVFKNMKECFNETNSYVFINQKALKNEKLKNEKLNNCSENLENKNNN